MENYLRLRNQVLTWGVDALPNPPLASTPMPAMSAEDLLGLLADALGNINALRLNNTLKPGDRS